MIPRGDPNTHLIEHPGPALLSETVWNQIHRDYARHACVYQSDAVAQALAQVGELSDKEVTSLLGLGARGG